MASKQRPQAGPISGDIKRKFDIVAALSSLDNPSLNDLHFCTGIPKATLKRQISHLRAEFGMKIRFVRDNKGVRGAVGHYELLDWGVLSKSRFQRSYRQERTHD
jgi:hypothetical protein